MNPTTWMDDTDQALESAARRWVAQRHRFEDRQHLAPDRRRHDPAIWRSLAELGWFAVATSETHGGFGLRPSSIALLCQIAGSALLTEPLLSCGVLAPQLIEALGDAAQRSKWLPEMQQGTRLVVALVPPDQGVRPGVTLTADGRLQGRLEVAVDADIADVLLIPADGRLWYLPVSASGVQRQPYPLLDGRGAATVHLAAAIAEPLADPEGRFADAMAQARALAAVAVASDSVGLMQSAFDQTLEHLKTRRQFGMPIGSNQALQHRAVDAYIRIAESRAVIDEAVAALCCNAPPVEAARAVHAAKALACENARKLTQEAVQMHGGIGITEEHAASHYLRRARVNAQWHGAEDLHLAAFVRAGGAPTPQEI